MQRLAPAHSCPRLTLARPPPDAAYLVLSRYERRDVNPITGLPTYDRATAWDGDNDANGPCCVGAAAVQAHDSHHGRAAPSVGAAASGAGMGAGMHADLPARFLLKADYYTAKDLRCGSTISVFGRELLLRDCDSFTKQWYHDNLELEQVSIANVDVGVRACGSRCCLSFVVRCRRNSKRCRRPRRVVEVCWTWCVALCGAVRLLNPVRVFHRPSPCCYVCVYVDCRSCHRARWLTCGRPHHRPPRWARHRRTSTATRSAPTRATCVRCCASSPTIPTSRRGGSSCRTLHVA